MISAVGPEVRRASSGTTIRLCSSWTRRRVGRSSDDSSLVVARASASRIGGFTDAPSACAAMVSTSASSAVSASGRR